ncbi:hypothetical protein TKK_0013818 [Trichogramma kaykai]
MTYGRNPQAINEHNRNLNSNGARQSSIASPQISATHPPNTPETGAPYRRPFLLIMTRDDENAPTTTTAAELMEATQRMTLQQ